MLRPVADAGSVNDLQGVPFIEGIVTVKHDMEYFQLIELACCSCQVIVVPLIRLGSSTPSISREWPLVRYKSACGTPEASAAWCDSHRQHAFVPTKRRIRFVRMGGNPSHSDAFPQTPNAISNPEILYFIPVDSPNPVCLSRYREVEEGSRSRKTPSAPSSVISGPRRRPIRTDRTDFQRAMRISCGCRHHHLPLSTGSCSLQKSRRLSRPGV